MTQLSYYYCIPKTEPNLGYSDFRQKNLGPCRSLSANESYVAWPKLHLEPLQNTVLTKKCSTSSLFVECTLFSCTTSYHFLDIILEFRGLLIPTFMVVKILIVLLVFNHIFLCLASFVFYCGSIFLSVLVASGAVQAMQCILWADVFSSISLNVFQPEKSLLQYSLKSCSMTKNLIICRLG